MCTRRRFGAAVLVAALALLGFTAGEGRAAFAFTMSFTVGTGTPVDIGPFATVSPDGTSYSLTDLAGLNTALNTAGSEYQFTSLSGSSNIPGSSTMGQLILTGALNLGNGTGNNAVLTLTEREVGFISPTGASDTLASSSTANFDFVRVGGGETVSSDFNMFSAGPYPLASNAFPDSNTQMGSASQAVTNGGGPYTLENEITFRLLGNPAVAGGIIPDAPVASDSFSTTATVTPAVTAVPAPPSVIPLAIGALGLLGYGWRKRRQAA
jgi:hypothetical protein